MAKRERERERVEWETLLHDLEVDGTLLVELMKRDHGKVP